MGWLERLSRTVFSWFSRKEVKTPLSFFFRILSAITLIVLTAMLLCEPTQRFNIFLIGLLACALLFLGVYLFAWIRPKHLVYGEAGYRAESKFAFGTESHEIREAELTIEEGMTNPKSITGESA
jgi:hypothetical protein